MLSGGNLNGLETLKEMLNIFSHEGSENQNYFEISLTAIRMAKIN